jgi:5-formyltetrahydrofolate cyclo-ligase
MTDKQRIRNAMRLRLDAMSEKERQMLSMLSAQNAMLTPEIRNAKCVLLYAPMADEPDVWTLIETLLMRNRKVLLPVTKNGAIIPAEYRAGDLLLLSRYGILEPDVSLAVDPQTIDVAIIPGLAFDERGYRIGRGAGYYDRFLVGLKCIRIGLCFEQQVEKLVPSEAHDIAMDAVCTDKRLIVCSSRVTPLCVPKPSQ